jgi:phage FluMu gp28-like protein
MTTLQVRLPILHQAQETIVNYPERYKVVCCGRRFGKTALAVDLLCNAAIDGLKVAYFAPSARMVVEVWNSLKETLAPIIATKHESHLNIRLITGGTIRVWGLKNPSSVRGNAYHLVVIDEAAFIPNLLKVWQRVISPTLSDYMGTAYFFSTPNGHNGFWHLWNRGNDPLFPDWQSWVFPTAANPYIDAAEIEKQRLEIPEKTYRQEYLAEFIADSGGVFRNVPTLSKLAPQTPVYGHTYVFGVDWGKSEDFTVVSVLDATTKEQVYLERFNQISWHLQRELLLRLYAEYRPALIIAESNSIGEVNIEALQREGLPIQPFFMSSSSKPRLIDDLVLALEQQRLSLLNDPVQIAELLSFEVTRNPTGTYRYSAPSGSHDDVVIALALSWQGVLQGSSSILIL